MLDKYNHLEVEKDKYKFWLEKKYFESKDKSLEPFCIVIPPPNVTGKLHLGHAWDTALQDIIIRYKKLSGFDAVWIPGMDHAGVATQAKIDERLKNNNINPKSMSREEWLKHAWSWKEEYASTIRSQWAELGLSLDYTKERFTFDSKLNDAVNKVFIDLYNKNLIYKGKKIINFDPKIKTALSNIEVIYKEVEGKFYYLKYKIENSSEYLEVATTRPETLFGDTAVAVNPNDKRYKHLIGRNVILPIVNKLIPIIEDDYAQMDFGTGVVKITPAHDPNDFEVGNRHNLERILCINVDGVMNENALDYNNLDRFICRNKLIEDLKNQNLLIKIENIKHSVGFSERSDVMVEPLLSDQWFVKTESLAKKVLENQKSNNKVEFIPKRFEKILINWMENIQDWCISRQIWWGHRIPAYKKDDEIYVGLNPPSGYIQDEDVLDTWFSSALWPFSAIGWPNSFDDRYFPNSVLVTGYDIIFFWVSRMIFTSLEFTNNIPFKEVLIHGLIRDEQGRKMSKSLGNGIDPMDVIKEYGADSLRYFLTTNTSPGLDLRYDSEKIKSSWNYINKIYNASKYVLMNIENKNSDLSTIDKWIITKLNLTIKSVTKNMEKYEFQNVATELYKFVHNDFCDYYIEYSKFQKNEKVLILVLESILKMLHPFMPFVTEEIYLKLNKEESIMISEYPVYSKKGIYKVESELIEKSNEFVSKIRSIIKENNITKKMLVTLSSNNKELEFILSNLLRLNKYLGDKTSKVIKLVEESIDCEVLFYLTEDIKKDNSKEIELLLKSIKKRKKLLSNLNFVNKASKEIVDLEKEKLLEEEKEVMKLKKEGK